MASEKQLTEFLLPQATVVNPPQRSRKLCWAVIGAFVLAGTVYLVPSLALLLSHALPSCLHAHHSRTQLEALCPQESSLYPQKHADLWADLDHTYGADDFKKNAIQWLGGAVRVPTVVNDQQRPVGEDGRWEVFGPFHEYLLKVYPVVHSTLKLTKVNTWGLVYEWKGTDANSKPLLLTAHQDVVPVEQGTVDQWGHPPFSGHFDGESIWGRGSSDDKSGVIGIMTTIETLLSKNFLPTRTVVLAFGFDEEASGFKGAASIAPVLESMYGKNGYAMLVDEGGHFDELFGTVFANLAISEKGGTNTRVTVATAGGHSSLPPEHTSIGILSRLLVELESNPLPVTLARGTPMYNTVQCYAAHGTDLPHGLRRAVVASSHSDRALSKAQKILTAYDANFKSLIGTTQAIDLIQGGHKANALPEEAWAVVDHRIATDSTLVAVQAADTKRLTKLAKHFNLTFNAFGEVLAEGGSGTLTLSDAWGTSLEPAPLTPTGVNAKPSRLISGTIRAVHAATAGEEDGIVIAPSIMSGNTDTRHYWNLTEHIFRYNHWNMSGEKTLSGVHTVNEHMRVEGFLGMIRYFTALILNADEADL
ncbi:carboxypeptidase S [Peniophora sp. CONT]|nr:carboxypeptidase S [Peniophora sp. CONT]